MPNWCDNLVHITFENDKCLEAFVKAYFKGVEQNFESFETEAFAADVEWDFERIIPNPYHSWGTKWMPDCNINRVTNNLLRIEFDSAWAPPTAIYEFLWINRQAYGIVNLSAEYAEGGCCLAGRWINGQDIQYEESTDEYKQLMEEHGYCFDQEE